MYEQGRGVPQDYVESHMWYNLAASNASGDNREGFTNERDHVAKKMTPEQIAEAQRRAREWKPK
jgi:TPR repeat protein